MSGAAVCDADRHACISAGCLFKALGGRACEACTEDVSIEARVHVVEHDDHAASTDHAYAIALAHECAQVLSQGT